MNRSEPMDESSGAPLCPPTVPSDMLAPIQPRLPCPFQGSQCQLSENIVELQSSQYQVLTGPTPGPSTSSVSSSWFSDEPAMSTMMVDMQTDQQDPPQPVIDFTSTDELEALLKSICSSLEGTVQGDSGEDPGKGVSEMNNQQAVCSSSNCRAPPASSQPSTSNQQYEGGKPKSWKPCHCSRSQCLKLYCECFANGLTCSGCKCSNCLNNTEHEDERQKAIKVTLEKNPIAFRPKIAGGESGLAQGRHNKGCNCKRSHCLKSYCECFQNNIECTPSCNCVDCRNYDDRSQTANKEEGQGATGLTLPAVESVCSRLLSKAREAEITGQEASVAERMVLEEFGLCLSQIVENMFGSKPNPDNPTKFPF